MASFRLPAIWLPHTLRRQFLLAVSVLILLILAGGLTAVYSLHTSAETIRQLAEERLVRMQEAQDLLLRTLFIERMSYQLLETSSQSELHEHYEGIIQELTVFDDLVNRLAAETKGDTLLDLHHTSQLFRNTANIAAQIREEELKAGRNSHALSRDTGKNGHYYLHELHLQAEALMETAQVQSERFTGCYRKAVQRLNVLTQKHVQWITFLLFGSLIMALIVAQWFLGRHVLGRLQRISRALRLDDKGIQEETKTVLHTPDISFFDEIDEMARAVELFREDRRQLGQRTAELVQARDAANAANKAKSLFLANMSHELRTPLNAILGFSGILHHEPDLTDKQRHHLGIINRSGTHLLKLINDVLEIAKIESGELVLDITPFDLGDMVRDVHDMMQLRAEQKGLHLVFDQSSEFPRYIKGDEARLRQILVNLVGNAVKFTKEGSVTIRLGVKENKRHHLLIEVEDTGPGISPDDQKKLFRPFVQLTEGLDQGGTGLGLSISRQFALLMGGEITLVSTPGEGSLFRLDLPLTLADENEVRRLHEEVQGDVVGMAPGQKAYRVLIAEDQYDNMLLLQQLMEHIGIETRTAENGEQCIQVFRDWKPDLIWMDQRMPVMNGLEATRKIRNIPGGENVKIVAVTASVFKEQQPQLQSAGIDALIHKPYRISEIYDCMATLLGIQFIYHETLAAEGPEALTPGKLAVLPEHLRRNLKAALERLDQGRLLDLLQEVGQIDKELKEILSRIVDNFDYPQILNLLDQTERHS